jgi:hypothetical protein
VAPLVQHVKRLQATQVALAGRAHVRKAWVASVKAHDAKKDKVGSGWGVGGPAANASLRLLLLSLLSLPRALSPPRRGERPKPTLRPNAPTGAETRTTLDANLFSNNIKK